MKTAGNARLVSKLKKFPGAEKAVPGNRWLDKKVGVVLLRLGKKALLKYQVWICRRAR